jgi:RimJ/RimL family protein N-acetyltransferase
VGTRPEAVRIEGAHVALVPLSLEHAEDLLEAARDPEIWRYLLVPQPRSLVDMREWISRALASEDHLPFAIVRRADQKVVGTTRYLEIRPYDRVLEIGWTWLAKEAQRTPVNTECKYLLLRYAFETLKCVRVQLKTDANNARSRAAIERIGGSLEGILRNFQRYWHGAARDTAMYAITDADWPEVRERLLRRMG